MTNPVGYLGADRAEVNKGLATLYAQLRDKLTASDGKLDGSFSQSFTTADGDVTLTLSTASLKAYAGTRIEDGSRYAGSAIQSDDIGLNLTRVVKYQDGATGTSTAASNPIRDAADLAASQQQAAANTDQQFQDYQNFSIEDQIAKHQQFAAAYAASLDDSSDLAQKASQPQSTPDLTAAASKQQEANKLIDTLTSFLQGLKSDQHDIAGTLADHASRTSSDVSGNDATNKNASTSSLLIRIDVKA